jgi:hypothetical protein
MSNLPPSLVTGTLHRRPLSTSLLAHSPLTLIISSVSRLTPTEVCEEIERSEAQAAERHVTIYFEDKDMEIACGGVVF